MGYMQTLTAEERVALVRRTAARNRMMYATLSVVGALGFILLWQASVVMGILPEKFVSTPLKIISLFFVKLVDSAPDGSTLGVNILASLQIALAGFVLAAVVGVALGLIMGWYRGFDYFMRPVFEILRPIPPVSWIPLTIVWLGIGLQAKAFIVFFAAFVPCLINSYTGIRQTNPVLINVAKTCGASNFEVFRRVGIPSSMPMVFAGLRVALGTAWATLVAAEMLASSSGLGYMILMGRNYARADIIILGIVVIGLIGVLFVAGLGFLEERVLGWRKR
jgi:NitT/TauT family transport system permease protein